MVEDDMTNENRPGGYKFDLDVQLETTIDNYEQDREQFWQEANEPELAVARVAFTQAETIADALLNSADTLLPHDELPDVKSELGADRTTFLHDVTTYKTAVLQAYNKHGLSPPPSEMYHLEMAGRPEEGPLKLVWERLCIKLAWDGVGSIRDGALRILKLWGLLLDIQPGEGTLSFLQRVGRCFIWGFDPECIILCRGVLDAAFRDAVSDDVCMTIYPNRKPEDRDFGLANRIVAAYKSNLIDKPTKIMAFAIKTRGDKAVHYDPLATKDVAATIRDTLIVLRRLDGGDSP
ncbi:MAG TPA: hypothetical protein VMX36_02415 [Sedimentisphaerales bacterium]|nr:hypothetical protein [Sedimentisphaerales bacterium]